MTNTKNEPGFETDVDELPEGANRSEHTLEELQPPNDEAASAMEEAQEDAAEQRKKGGYQ